jgi:hypothetical protein
MQRAKLLAYVKKNIHDIKRILQDKQSSTAQIRAEGNNTKCVGKKRFKGNVTHGLRKEHVLRSPSHFGQGKIIYANILP